MKYPAPLCVTLAAFCGGNGRLLGGSDFLGAHLDPLADGEHALDAVVASLAENGTAGKPLRADPPLSEFLSSGGWPPVESWGRAFAAALSGAASEPCSAPLLGRARLSPYGFGARLNHFANEAALAVYAGRPLALCAPPGVRDSWERYYQDPGFSRCGSCDWGGGPRNYPKVGHDISNGHDHEQVAALKRFLYGRMFVLKPEVQADVDTSLANLGLTDGSYVGVHVRRGDKDQEVPPVPIERYVAAVAEMCSQVGATKVFLASDDASIHEVLQERLGASYSVVEQLRLPAEDYALRGEAARGAVPAFGVEDEEKSVLVDVAALVRAAAFVGTASSNIGRLVFFERAASGPALSLDEGGNDGFVVLRDP